MADSDLRTVIQVGLSPLEAKLITWSLAQAGAIADGDTAAQLSIAFRIHELVNSMRDGEYNVLVERLERLIKAAVPDAVFADEQIREDPECPHCPCLTHTCCWCGKEKPWTIEL